MTHWTPVVAAIISPPHELMANEILQNKNLDYPDTCGDDLTDKNSKYQKQHAHNPLILLGQRKAGDFLAENWEFPGGKIERGESPEEALARELSEELSIKAEIGPLRKAVAWSYPKLDVIILFYHVTIWQGIPKARVHKQIEWFFTSELPTLEFPMANRPVVRELLKETNFSASSLEFTNPI